MAKHCVNHNSPEVITMAKRLEVHPIIAAAKIALWQEKENDLTKWPSVDQLRDFTEELVADGLPRSLKIDEDGYYYESQDSNGSTIIPSTWTNATIRQYPQIAEAIVSKLQKLYPEVVIQKDGIVNAQGLYFPLGDSTGLHYRDAFISAVSWSNDSSLEVPPHEYAHHYIDMFQNHPLVKEAISRYGKEQLVRNISRYYMEKEMSGWFSDFMDRFWDMVKSLFGNSDIQKELAKSFRRGERLGEEAMGTGELSFMRPDKEKKTGEFFSEIKTKFDGTFKTYGNFVESNLDAVPVDVAKRVLVKSFEDLVNEETGQFKPGVSDDFIKRYFSGIVTNLWVQLQKIDTVKGRYRNSPLLHEKRIVEDLLPYLSSNDTTINDVLKKLLTDEDVELVGQPKEMYDLIIRMQQRIFYAAKTSQSYYGNYGKSVDALSVNRHLDKEISGAQNKKAETYSKVKNKYLRNSLKWVESRLMSKNINKLTLSMILSGGEKTAFTEFFYRSLKNAHRKFNEANMSMEKKLTLTNKPKDFNDWSYITSGKKSIDKLVGKEFVFRLNDQDKMVKLTNQEILNIYMLSRQNDPNQHGKFPPLDALINNGIYLSDTIDGREVKITDNLKFREKGIEEIIDYVTLNPVMMEMVTKFDDASDSIHAYTNDTFKQEMGYDLPKMTNYFPVSVGERNLDIKSAFSELEGLSSAKERLGEKKPLLIGDALAVYDNYKQSALLYATHALEVDNNRKMLDALRGKYSHSEDMKVYFDQIEASLNKIETGGTLFISRAEKDMEGALNKLTSNLSVSVLAYNIPVLFKQPVSFLAAKMEIDPKYLKKAGFGVGGFVGVKPGDIIKSLKYTGINSGETKLPFEWHFPSDHPVLEEIMSYSPTLGMRTMGVINRELGEAFLDMKAGDDRIKIPGVDLYISKKRSMAGIITWDTATMVQIWEAVKHETMEKYPQLAPGSSAFWEHVAGRTEEVYSKTQPTHDIMDQSALEESTNPIARIFTMFGSPRSKLANLFAQNVLRYFAHPSKENLNKLKSAFMNIFVYTGLSLAAVDILFAMLRGKVGDDDEVTDMMAMTLTTNALGTFWGLGELSRMVMSRIDDQPWTANLEHPFQTLVSKSADVVSHVYNGDFEKAFFKAGGVFANVTGLPVAPLNYSKDLYDGLFSEK